MAERAQVKSVEAIALFRSSLIVFLTKARANVEEVSAEVQRTQAWLENDRRSYWENECRRRQRALDEAGQQLFSAKISRIHVQSAAQVLAVERAKRALREAEEKRDAVKRWTREFSNRAAPLAKQVEQLLTYITTDLGKAVAHLGALVKSLDAYASTSPTLNPAASSHAELTSDPDQAPPLPAALSEEGERP